MAGSVVLTGRVGVRCHLEAATPEKTTGILVATSNLGNQVVLQFQVPAGHGSRTASIPLLLRSNTAYVLDAALPDDHLEAHLHLSPAVANGNGSRLASTAVEGFVGSAGEITAQGVLATGERISAGGTDQDPDNAIRTTLEVNIPDVSNPQAFRLVLTMRATD